MTPEPSFATAGRSGWLSSPGPFSIGNFAKAVLIVTAIAGTLDIIAAHLHIWVVRGSFPTQVFKGIAGGAFGPLDWAVIAAIPVIGVALAIVTARVTVLVALRRML